MTVAISVFFRKEAKHFQLKNREIWKHKNCAKVNNQEKQEGDRDKDGDGDGDVERKESVYVCTEKIHTSQGPFDGSVSESSVKKRRHGMTPEEERKSGATAPGAPPEPAEEMGEEGRSETERRVSGAGCLGRERSRERWARQAARWAA